MTTSTFWCSCFDFNKIIAILPILILEQSMQMSMIENNNILEIS